MSLTEIIRAVKKLSPSDRTKVAEALRSVEADEPACNPTGHDELNRRLLNQGLLKRIPNQRSSNRRFNPIKITGQPLSQTIIEERR